MLFCTVVFWNFLEKTISKLNKFLLFSNILEIVAMMLLFFLLSSVKEQKTIFFSSHDVSKPDSGSYLSEVIILQRFITYFHTVSANDPYLQPQGWIAKGAAQRDRPKLMHLKGTSAKWSWMIPEHSSQARCFFDLECNGFFRWLKLITSVLLHRVVFKKPIPK